jgi:hypothetical protein
MKKVCIAALLLFITLHLTAQEDTAIVYINKASAATCTVKAEQTTATLRLKKILLKNVQQFTVQIKTAWLNNKVYVRQLEIESDSIEIVAEIKDKPGYFDIYKTNTKKKLLAGKTVKLYLLLDPANSKMRIASRRIYAGTIIVK